MYGNNIEATGFQRVNVLLKDNTDPAATVVVPGKRYYFPENPFLENKKIVGIEAHGRRNVPASLSGDLNDLSGTEGASNTLTSQARFFYVTLYDKKGFIKFENVPLTSLIQAPDPAGLIVALHKRIKPYSGMIDFSRSYIYIPANLLVSVGISYVPITFYYV